MTKGLNDDQESYKVVASSILDKRGKTFEGGRYVGTSPIKAARKAAKKLLALASTKASEFGHNKGVDTVIFKIRQTTRASDHKEYVYKAKKLKGKVEMTTIKIGKQTLQVPKSAMIDIEPAEESDLISAVQAAKSKL
jgi:hypothetical protein